MEIGLIIAGITSLIVVFLAWRFPETKNDYNFSNIITDNNLHAPIILKNIPLENQNDRLNLIKQRGIIYAGCVNWEPFSSYTRTANGYAGNGLYPAILNIAAKNNNLHVIYSPVDWDNAKDSINSGKLDLILPALMTPLRAEYADFCCIMHRLGVGGVARIDNERVLHLQEKGNAEGKNGLADPGLRLGVVKHEIGWEYAYLNLDLEGNQHRFTVLEELEVNKIGSLVKNGVVDVFLADSISCSQACEVSPGILVDKFFKGPTIFGKECGILIPRCQSTLSTWLEKEVSSAREHPKIVKMEKEIANRLGGMVLWSFRVFPKW